MIKDAIAILADRAALTEQEAESVMLEIMDGAATPAQIAAYLMGLRLKGETVEEISGSVRAMRAKAVRIAVGDPLVVDTCGTGGDGAHTFNISTTTALVLAGAGLTVAKHGNRSVSSKSGSADVLSALGVTIDLPTERVADCINEVGIGFLFAPLYHGAMKHCAGPRQEMGIRTMLNLLGPLTNPAGATIQVLGVYEGRLTSLLGNVLMRSGVAALLCRPWNGRTRRDHADRQDTDFGSQGRCSFKLSSGPSGVWAETGSSQTTGRGYAKRKCGDDTRYSPGTERTETGHRVFECRTGPCCRAQGDDPSRGVPLGRPDDRFWSGSGEAGSPHRIYKEGLTSS